MKSLTGVLPLSGDALSTFAYFALFLHGGVSFVYMSEMPVFKPNDFFWEHHWDGKEVRWMAYARAVQKIIADELGVPTSESSLKEKFEYKSLKKAKKSSTKNKEI